MKKATLFLFLLSSLVYVLSCTHDPEFDLDSQLLRSLNEHSTGETYQSYILPSSNDYANLPNQDVKNPVTAEKVALGKLLFFETGLALQPKYPVSKEA